MTEVTEIARARVAKLLEDWDWPEPETLEKILALGDDAVPALAEVLTPERLEDARLDGEADAVVYYTLELLAALGTSAAVSCFLETYPQIDDDMVEGMEDAVRRLGPDALDRLLAIVADPSLTYYSRAIVAGGAMHEANLHPELRPRVAESLRLILAGYLERPLPLTDDDKEMVASLVVDLAELADPLARPLIAEAFATGRIYTAEESPLGIPMIDEAEVEELYAEGGQIDDWVPLPYLEKYRTRRRSHLEEQQRLSRLKLLDQEPAPKPVVLGTKLGRNDPCWCGSGKKYKKCHLAEDETNKVRL